jgi:HAD superfamily hydrolase (TIGR01549 family)
VRAVLFDWSNTLVRFEWDNDLLEVGHRAGLSAVGRGEEAAAFTERFRSEIYPRLTPNDDYNAMLRDELGLDAAEAERFVVAEYETWRPATTLADAAHALLESLRGQGLKLGIVANHWPEPAWLVRKEIAEFGVAERVDTIVLSGESGVRKPDPAIFLQALSELGVDGDDAMFVGDKLDSDIRGAAEVGMVTVQALWFEADDAKGLPEPDFMAFTLMDVLTAVRRVAATD